MDINEILSRLYKELEMKLLIGDKDEVKRLVKEIERLENGLIKEG